MPTWGADTGIDVVTGSTELDSGDSRMAASRGTLGGGNDGSRVLKLAAAPATLLPLAPAPPLLPTLVLFAWPAPWPLLSLFAVEVRPPCGVSSM